jgi:putative hemolysin
MTREGRRLGTVARPAPPASLVSRGFPPPDVVIEHGKYRVRFARQPDDRDLALQLRFRVFNLEMDEGLAASHETGRDEDPFDAVCHHLLIEDLSAGRLIGTYRMQTREMAACSRGFYSAGEFDLSDLPEEVMARSVEVGRACIEKRYRNRHVLFLLWKGLAAYVTHHEKRYLFGCCSLSEQDPAEGVRVSRQLARNGYLHPELSVEPLPEAACVVVGELPDPAPERELDLPALFRTYLRYGAKVCGPPAVDREFRTIDFFVILDVQQLDRDLYRLFFS